MSEATALLVLAAGLAAAIARSCWVPDWAVAAGGGLLLVVLGALSPAARRGALSGHGPTVGFLVALLLLADGCRRAGLFEALCVLMARGSRGRPRRLLAMVFLASGASTGC